jgi:hypothetical protein
VPCQRHRRRENLREHSGSDRLSKGSKKRRDSKAKKRKSILTTLAQHQRVKKKLIPPLNRLPAPVKFSRWADERMPEMLWACLVRATLPRDQALEVFRGVALIARELVEAPGMLSEIIPTHSNLAARFPELIPRVVRLATRFPLGYAALRPLIAIESLPGREHWIEALGMEPDSGELNALADAIPEFLGHQTEHSTDVRWLLLLFGGLSHKIHYPASMSGRVDELCEYPRKGDMRSVRPFIRSGEPMVWMPASGDPAFPWSEQFWKECHERTPCLVVEPEAVEVNQYKSSKVGPQVIQAINDVSDHWIDTSKSTAVDAGHEGSFTFVLYALTCLLEMLGRNRVGISGRLLLRTVAECRITFAYLLYKNDPELWKKFRAYGAGQAKLVLLKMKDSDKTPFSISMEKLERLANEDVWQEYVDIDLGNWAGADLRKMAEDSGTKEIYDAHYGWNSGYSHGHWAAMRDVTLTTCLNPLHRLHRVPVAGENGLGDVVPDAIEIVEAMIGDLLRVYPGASISLHKEVPGEAVAGQSEPPSAGGDAGAT